jgi:hypothetical protein
MEIRRLPLNELEGTDKIAQNGKIFYSKEVNPIRIFSGALKPAGII